MKDAERYPPPAPGMRLAGLLAAAAVSAFVIGSQLGLADGYTVAADAQMVAAARARAVAAQASAAPQAQAQAQAQVQAPKVGTLAPPGTEQKKAI